MKSLEFSNGDKMDMIGLGTWKSDKGEVYNAVREAIKLGYRHFDCSPIYGNEVEIGGAFKDAIDANDVTRKELWITSKLWNNSHEENEVVPAIKETLADLKLDYLDLWLIHWPVAQKREVRGASSGSDFVSLDQIPLSETWRGMEKCLDLILANHIGVSNFSIPKIEEIHKTSTRRIELNQIELHPLLQQTGMLEYCKKESIHLTAYSPLGSRDRIEAMKAEDEVSLLDNKTILAIADKHQCTSGQVLVNWATTRGTAVIPKSTNPNRLQQNLEASKLVLDENDMDMIASLDEHYRYVKGDFWARPGSPYSVESLWDE